MAIEIVAGPVANAKTNGAAALTLTLPTMQEGDFVVAWGGHYYRAGVSVAPTDAGWTQQALANSSNPGCGVWTKFMGSTPDTSITFAASGNNADAIAGGVYVLRGVDPTTPIDAAIGSVAGSNPAAVTVATAGALVLVLAFGAPTTFDSTPGTISGYAFPTIGGLPYAADTNDAVVFAAHLENATTGVNDPPAWSTLTATGMHQFTVAVRPASAPTSTTYSLSGTTSVATAAIGNITAVRSINGITPVTTSTSAAINAVRKISGITPVVTTVAGNITVVEGEPEFVRIIKLALGDAYLDTYADEYGATGWVGVPVKLWNGSAWVEVQARTYVNGAWAP